MTHSDHLADDVFSALVDDQLSPAEAAVAEVHMAACVICQTRLTDMRELVSMVRSLPLLEPPRDFQIGPRLVQDPPNLVRLRRWYAWSRAGAAALAAAFVFLSAGTLYVDARLATAPMTLSATNQPGAADAAAAASAAPPAKALAPQAPPPGPAPAAGAAAAAAPAAAIRSQAVATPAGGEAADQIAAATTVRPLPTPAVPTPTLLARAPTSAAAVPVSATTPQIDLGAPLRIAAIVFGGLAVVAVIGALFIRHRLRAISPFPQE